jgi:hypothetical protein
MNAWIVKFHIIDISTNIDNYLEKKLDMDASMSVYYPNRLIYKA